MSNVFCIKTGEPVKPKRNIPGMSLKVSDKIDDLKKVMIDLVKESNCRPLETVVIIPWSDNRVSLASLNENVSKAELLSIFDRALDKLKENDE